MIVLWQVICRYYLSSKTNIISLIFLIRDIQKPEKSRDLYKVTQLVNKRTQIWSQAIWLMLLPSLPLFSTTYQYWPVVQLSSGSHFWSFSKVWSPWSHPCDIYIFHYIIICTFHTHILLCYCTVKEMLCLLISYLFILS